MKASHAWLRELSGVDASASDVAERLTRVGLEVEGIDRFGEGLGSVVIAEVRSCEPHPSRDRLSVVRVFDGKDEHTVVCGAPNVPARGGRVALAKVGATLPGGLAIAAREVAGVASHGMLCSERELGIGADGDGILVLDEGQAGRVGAELASALGLRDAVFDISLTPNRPDCLGHVGLAREVALAFGRAFEPQIPAAPYRVLSEQSTPSTVLSALPVLDPEARHPGETLTLVSPTNGTPIAIPISITAPERCTRYLGVVVQGVRVERSPFWMRYRLHVLGQRSIDNVVDITNLVLLEWGHPIHAFDLGALRGREIVVRLASEGERLTTLDDVDRALSTDDLVIADGVGPVAIAGVMGGAQSGVRPATRDVLLEVAWFDPRSVRRTSRRHGLHTDASHRFERGCDPWALPTVMRRALALLTTLAEGATSGVATDAVGAKQAARTIALRPAHVSAFLGVDVPERETRRVLEGIGCTISPGDDGEGWRVQAPTWRPDLGREVDLVEEVARVRGYDLVPEALARIAPRSEAPSPRFAVSRALRRAATGAGLFEAVNFSFVAPRDHAICRVATEAVELANPLSEERSVMRTSLVPGLLADVARSQRHGAPRIRIFELGRIYTPRPGERLPAETLSLGIAIAGPRAKWIGEEPAVDFWDGKGAVEAVLARVGLSITTVPAIEEAADVAFLHPRRRARVMVGQRAVGVLGEVHPDVAEATEVVGAAVVAVLDAEALIELVAATGPAQVRGLPRFPAVVRDLALIVDEPVLAGELIAAFTAASSGLVERVELFDVFRGPQVGAGKKSLMLRVAYRDAEATLTDARIQSVCDEAVRAVNAALGAELRA